MMPDWDMNGDTTRAVYEGQITRLQARVSELEAAQEWRPITEAPKDTLIDIWIAHTDGGERWSDCYYDRICDEWRTSRPSGHLISVKAGAVSHWRPLPAPPVGDR